MPSKADEDIHYFDDAVLHSGLIPPGSFFWRWTMVPASIISQQQKGKGKGKGKYQIVVRTHFLKLFLFIHPFVGSFKT